MISFRDEKGKEDPEVESKSGSEPDEEGPKEKKDVKSETEKRRHYRNRQNSYSSDEGGRRRYVSQAIECITGY